MSLPEFQRARQGPPPMTPIERRCADRQADLAVIAQAIPRACYHCGCVYLDFPDGHDAHEVVLGHRPVGDQGGGR